MGKYVTVSVKIPVEVKEMLDKLGIKPSSLLKKAIKEEILKREAYEIKKELNGMKILLEKFSIGEIVESIREDRMSG
jgi:hypothetical protein